MEVLDIGVDAQELSVERDIVLLFFLQLTTEEGQNVLQLVPVSERGGDGSLRDVCRVVRYLMIATDKVHLAEDNLACEVGHEIVDPWDRVPHGHHLPSGLTITWSGDE